LPSLSSAASCSRRVSPVETKLAQLKYVGAIEAKEIAGALDASCLMRELSPIFGDGLIDQAAAAAA
jgi:hypothetical protein